METNQIEHDTITPTEKLVIPENQNPNTMEDIAMLNPTEHDIADEMLLMDPFRDLNRENRGMTSDYL